MWLPHEAPYTDTRSVALVEYVAAAEQPGDGLVLSYAAGFLVAVYGPWPFSISGSRRVHNGTIPEVKRPGTLRLPVGNPLDEESTQEVVRDYLAGGRPGRIWYIAYWSGKWDIPGVLEQEGYAVRDIVTGAQDGVLYLALDVAELRTERR